MIQILLKGEYLDLETKTVTTFKKSQNLNGVQNQYSYSNNINLLPTSKNKRLIGFNYLPKSKSKSMANSIDVDVIFFGCIFLRKQKLKIQKETENIITGHLIYNESYFVSKSKETLMNQIPFENYSKDSYDFITLNGTNNVDFRTAPISAQNDSGLVLIEEVPMLYSFVYALKQIFTYFNYSFTGDFFTDVKIKEYYFNPNLGIYGVGGAPTFDNDLKVFDFVSSVLKTFNAYIDIDDIANYLVVNLWKNIENLKTNFKDYSSNFIKYEEYSFEVGLSKKNTLKYNSSPEFYNGYFTNNKSLNKESNYLTSDFGAGSMKLFDDIEVGATRDIGAIGEPSTINIYKFENSLSNVIFYGLGVLSNFNLYKAFSPNILDIYINFHETYTKNIEQPTTANFVFKYDPIFLQNFKMQEVFFIKELSSYWLPMELNFNSDKEFVKIKSLMIEKTAKERPTVFNLFLNLNFNEYYNFNDLSRIYSPLNTSKAQEITIHSFDLSKNKITINGTQIITFPTLVDISTVFLMEIENIEIINQKNTDNLLFSIKSLDGGVSRIANINIHHTGYAKYLSKFATPQNITFNIESDNFKQILYLANFCDKFQNIKNIPNTEVINFGYISPLDQNDYLHFKNLILTKDFQNITLLLKIGNASYATSNKGGKARAETKCYYNLYKNGQLLHTLHSNGSVDRYVNLPLVTTTDTEVQAFYQFSGVAGDVFSAVIEIVSTEEIRLGSGTMYMRCEFENIEWFFETTEQL